MVAVPLVVHCRANLQSVRGFRCYDNIAPNAKCQRVLVLALCPVFALSTERGDTLLEVNAAAVALLSEINTV